MVLSDSKIMEYMDNGSIAITPFTHDNINPCSVDLTLANEYKIYVADVLDVRKHNAAEEFTMSEDGIVIHPGKVYLYRCNELISISNKIRAKAEGKSSLGRLGLFVHVTAGFIDPGFHGSLVLELVAAQSIRIYPNMKICQIEFSLIHGNVNEAYGDKSNSKYNGQVGVQESLYYKNFTNGRGTK